MLHRTLQKGENKIRNQHPETTIIKHILHMYIHVHTHVHTHVHIYALYLLDQNGNIKYKFYML